MKQLFDSSEIVLDEADKKVVPEIKISYNSLPKKFFEGPVNSAEKVADFIRSLYPKGELELQEQFYVLYLNSALNIIGYYRHTVGTINATLADIRLILGTALKSGAISIIVAHNHPSGNTKPSDADISLTKKLKTAATSMEIALQDHVIVTKESYTSLREQGYLDGTAKEIDIRKIDKHVDTIIEGDAAETLKKFPDGSVDCVVTSPPYWQLRDYGFKSQWGLEKTYMQYLEKMFSLMDEIYRVLKDTGTVWINLGDSFFGSGNGEGQKYERNNLNRFEPAPKKGNHDRANNLRRKCLTLIPHRFAQGCVERGWIMRNDIIWAKPNGLPESVTDRFTKKHEHILFLVKQPKYYFDLDAVREPHKDSSMQRAKYLMSAFRGDANTKGGLGKGKKGGSKQKKVVPNSKGKNPGDVTDFWVIATKPNSEKHYAAYNTEIITKPILAGCPEGGIVLDPFCGTGTTAITALELGRHFIGIDAKGQYCRIARKRIVEMSKHKAVGELGHMNTNTKWQFVEQVEKDLENKVHHSKRSLEKLATNYGIHDKNLVKELTELAIVRRARTLAHADAGKEEKFRNIVELYNSQVNLSHRTSQSILLQQYSTPAPLGFLAGLFVGADKGVSVFEPSAGNGLLTIAGDEKNTTVNEIDSVRNENLQTQSFKEIIKQDATKPFADFAKSFEAVITNPPFGTLDKEVKYDSFPIKTLDHLMALRALDCMKDSGKAAIIIGGHTNWDEKGRIQSGKNRIFFNYLYSRYNVIDVINIDGSLYSRQGTSFDVRLILIDGRKSKVSGNAPPKNTDDATVKTFDELYERVIAAIAEYRLKNFSHYKELKKTHPDVLLLLRNDNIYEAFEEDAFHVSEILGIGFSNVGGHPYISFPVNSLDANLRTLVKHGKVAIADELKDENMNKNLSDLEREALQLQSLFKNKDLGTIEDEQEIVDHVQLYKRWKELKSKHKDELVLIEAPSQFITFESDAILLGKTLKLGYLNVKKEGYEFAESAISKAFMEEFFPKLDKAGVKVVVIPNGKPTNWGKIMEETFRFIKTGQDDFGDLGSPYVPASASCVVLNTQVPDSMSFETQQALEKIREEVGGDIDEFVRHRLGYHSKAQLCKALSAEQIDAVAMAIYNIEAREQGMIIGDQTGIGKGRVAAAMIRYGVNRKVKPIFITEKANLFSDIYRDLAAIGSAHLVPFIVNGRESKTDIKDEDGNIVYQALPLTEQQSIFESRKIPAKFHFVVGTYSQFNSPEKKPEKPAFLRAIAKDNIIIMDEAHNSSGSSNTGEFMQSVVADTKGVVFLSATFAKRADNMPIYAMKTAISDANMTRDELVEAILRGGVALQEVLSSQLVAEGQMLRRERSFEGVEVNYITLDDKEQEHKAIADNITEILRDIISFQAAFVDKQVEELDKIAVAEGKEVELREGTSQAGVDNQPYFSKVFNVINQMLFSIKAEAVAERAIARLKEGKKPVIAFSSTMGSFIEQMETDKGLPVSDGDTINADFAEVLKRGLEGILRYTEKDVDGKSISKSFAISDLSQDAQAEYRRIMERIKTASSGITISPIDVVIKKIQEAGYSVAEVTGRKYEVQLNLKTNKGLVMARKRLNTNDAFRKFNNNEVDVLMINQSGSTGASAHALPNAKISAKQVRQRVMIVLQAELDINTEVQKRGRINRTGQILKPIYDYVNSAIPAEKRLMMMLQKKLKSLDANTTSNQKQSTKILDVPDFLNKYGDKIVKEYLIENPEVNELLGDPLGLKTTKSDDGTLIEDAAHKVSGRVAVLSTKMQQDFYNEISERYNDYAEYLRQVGDYDLEVEAMDLKAQRIDWSIIKMGKGGDSMFGDDSILETVRANVLKKPFTRNELDNLLKESLGGRDSHELKAELQSNYEVFTANRLKEEIDEANAKYDHLIKEIPNEKKILKIASEAEKLRAIAQREKELDGARQLMLEQTQRVFHNRTAYLERILKYFHVGKVLSYPLESYNEGQQLILSTFLGFIIDRKKKNPFAPSSIKLRFAIANSGKYIAIPASYSEDITAIMGASSDAEDMDKEELLHEWENAIKESTHDRRIRHIITGNLLQAFSDFKGKLVSYTTNEEEVKKGILMPENWIPAEQVGDKIVVPISKAMTIIKSLTNGAAIFTNNNIGIFRHGDSYKVIVPSSRAKAGEIYLDEELLSIVDGNNFNKVSDRMVATFPNKKLETFIDILQRKFSSAVTLTSLQFDIIKDEKHERHSTRKKIELPPKRNEEENNVIRMYELEAEALALELELLAA
jgi:DNA modification methylase